MKTPTHNIFKFDSCREFLRCELVGRKLRALAERCGFKSPATISMFATGKRSLKPLAADKLAHGLGLTGRRRRYFLTLAALEAARSEREKSEVRSRLVRLRSMADESLLECRQYRFLSEPLFPIVYCLVGIAGLDQSPQALAARIPEGRADRVETTLVDLESLGLIHQVDGAWAQTQGPISTADGLPDGAQDAAVHGYHKNMIALADAALELPRDEREFNGLSVPVPRSQLPLIKERIRKFRRDLNEEMSRFTDAPADAQDPQDVYQLNMQFFPLTHPPATPLRKPQP